MAAPIASRSVPRCFKNSGRGAGIIVALACLTGCATTPAGDFLSTKTPYQPRQAIADYAPAPPGFVPLHTQLLARHGARAMTAMKDDLALLNLCRQAAPEQALHPLGRRLMDDIERLVQVQLLLGHGVAGISSPGYANLSRIGIDEQRGLAQRLLQRQAALFAARDGRTIAVEHSGVDRARDSATFFMQALREAAPALGAVIEAPVVNRYSLYFHKLHAGTDGVPDAGDPRLAVYRASQRYQQYQRSARLQSRLDAVNDDARLGPAARVVLERLFTTAFVDRLASGQLRVANVGATEAVSTDGSLHVRLEGNGKTVLASPVDALRALSALYEIAPGLRAELGRDFRPYIPDEQARLLAWLNDAEDFFVKGPGDAQDSPVTYQMAAGLLADFFEEAEQGSGRRLASFRFAHAETIIPLATLLGVAGSSTPVAAGQGFSYDNNPWRGSDVAPYAANIEWDTYRNGQGRLLVRMLYNERETDFKGACDGARFAAGSHFYDVAALRLCYQDAFPKAP